MLDLNNITLIALSSVRIPETIEALQYSCRSISFGSVKLVSHIKPDDLPTNIEYEYVDTLLDNTVLEQNPTEDQIVTTPREINLIISKDTTNNE